MKKLTVISSIFVVLACGHNSNTDTTAYQIQTESGWRDSSTSVKENPLPDEHSGCLATRGGDKQAAEDYCNEMEAARDPHILPPAYTSCMQYTNGNAYRCNQYLNTSMSYAPWIY